MTQFFKKNKWIILFSIILFGILVYCHFQTFIIGDDLAYSLYLRGNDRIDSIKEIIINQMSDYKWINARVFVHGVVQFLLMFDKNLWSILNPLVIVLIILIMSYLLWSFTKKNIKPIWFVLTSTLFFLLLYNYKYLIYWVAGSVNYVWMFLLMLLIMVYYYKFGLLKKPVLSFFILSLSSILCESTAIFSIVLIIGDAFIRLVVLRENKGDLIKYFAFLLGSVCCFLFLYLSPSTASRMTWNGDAWLEMPFIDKMLLAIPIISSSLFNCFNIYNLIPLFMVISLMYFMINSFGKKSLIFIVLTLIMIGLCFVLNNGWMYFALGIYILISQVFIFYKNGDIKLIPFIFIAYALSYALALTPEYLALRTGFFTLLLLGMFTIYNFYNFKRFSVIIKILFALLLAGLIIFEIIIYSYIGSVKNVRDDSIADVLNGNSDTVYVKEIKDPFNKFHIDANEPSSRDYWAIAMFERYYGLPEGVKIEFIK